jgi:hypothetical protein
MIDDLPVGNYKTIEKKDIIDDENIFGFIECRAKNLKGVECKVPAIGIRFENKYLFPYFDKYQTVHITSDEYYYYKTLNQYRFKLLKVYQYDRCPFYKEFVENLYSLKEKIDDGREPRNDAKRLIIKILLNSAYGLWALKRESGEITKFFNTITFKGQGQLYNEFSRKFIDNSVKAIDEIDENIVCLTYRDIVDVDEMNVNIASFITAKARIKLHKLLHYITFKGYHIYYCDTDSVITDYEIKEENMGEEPFKVTYKLGDLKSELRPKNKLFNGNYISDLTIRGPKNYAYKTNTGDEEIKLKGFNINQNFYVIDYDYKNKQIICDMPFVPNIDNVYDNKKKTFFTKKLIYNDIAYMEYSNFTLRMNLPQMKGGTRGVKEDNMTWGKNWKQLKPKSDEEYLVMTKGIYHQQTLQENGELFPFILNDAIQTEEEMIDYSIHHYYELFHN